MAISQYPSTNRCLGAYAENYFCYSTLPASAGSVYRFDTVAGTSAPLAESYLSGPAAIHAWYTERLAVDYVLTTSDICSLSISAYWSAANPNATLLLKLYRISQGTNVETEIGVYEGTTAKDNVISKDSHTFVRPVPVQLAVGERLLIRMWAIPPPGQTFNTGDLRYALGSSSAGNNQATLNLPAAVTFLGYNQTKVYMRRTTAAAIGNFFDALTSAGPVQGAATAVVATANVSEKQWTRTSGGTVIEWITPRFKEDWVFKTTGITGVTGRSAYTVTFVLESATSANVGYRVKLFRWRAGVETLALSMDYLSETTTAGAALALDNLNAQANTTNITLNQTDFKIDDRLVIRAYAIPVGGAMPSGQTGTLYYDTDNAGQQFWLTLFETLFFKAESDPAYVPPPGGLTMGSNVGL